MRPYSCEELHAITEEARRLRTMSVVEAIHELVLETARKGKYTYVYKRNPDMGIDNDMLKDIFTKLQTLFPGVLVNTDYSTCIAISWKDIL